MPEISDPMKFEGKITRRNILRLERVIARGVNGKEEGKRLRYRTLCP